jgi:hypothetical protein
MSNAQPARPQLMEQHASGCASSGSTPFVLCRYQGATCGACCWGKGVAKERLTAQLSRNRAVFDHYVAAAPQPSTWRLLVHELRASLGTHVVLAILLRLPVVRTVMRRWLADRLVCTFVAFEPNQSAGIGCLIHPSRHAGRDVRAQVAFRLLPGVECGRPSFRCKASVDLSHATEEMRSQALGPAAGVGWFDYSSYVRLLCDK